jgi:hypothetical protein
MAGPAPWESHDWRPIMSGRWLNMFFLINIKVTTQLQK